MTGHQESLEHFQCALTDLRGQSNWERRYVPTYPQSEEMIDIVIIVRPLMSYLDKQLVGMEAISDCYRYQPKFADRPMITPIVQKFRFPQKKYFPCWVLCNSSSVAQLVSPCLHSKRKFIHQVKVCVRSRLTVCINHAQKFQKTNLPIHHNIYFREYLIGYIFFGLNLN